MLVYKKLGVVRAFSLVSSYSNAVLWVLDLMSLGHDMFFYCCTAQTTLLTDGLLKRLF